MTVKIAFICVGNSARSQMAEGFGKYYSKKLKKDVEVYSAGSNPIGYVHPLAIKVMEERGINISKNKSKSLEDIPLDEIDYLITLCGEAEESCPNVRNVNIQHWGLPDPAKVEGSEDYKLFMFRKIRDEIDRKVKNLLEKL